MNDKGKLLIKLLIFSEAFFFIALIIAYVYYRNFRDVTDTVAGALHPWKTGIYTALLVGSSFTLIFSKKALFKEHFLRFKILMGATILLGVVFMYGQLSEYVDLYHKEITMHTDIFGSSFYTLTGFHGAHVILGLIALSVLFGLSFGSFRKITSAGIGGVDIYWHFVDVVWLFVFFFVYISPLL